MQFTNVVLPEPAIPIVMMTTGFLSLALLVDADDEEAMTEESVKSRPQESMETYNASILSPTTTVPCQASNDSWDNVS